MSNQSLFRTLPLFNCLSEADRAELEKQAVEQPWRKDEFIFRQGDSAEWFHILKEGTVKCVKSSPEGREVTLKVLLPGDLFCCEASAFNGSTHPGCAQAMDNAKVIKISRKVLFETIQRNPETAIQIISYLGDRLREVQDRAKAFGKRVKAPASCKNSSKCAQTVIKTFCRYLPFKQALVQRVIPAENLAFTAKWSPKMEASA